MKLNNVDGSIKSLVVPAISALLLSVLVGIAIFSVKSSAKQFSGEAMASDIVILAGIFDQIQKDCTILSFDTQKNPINFLTVGSFSGSALTGASNCVGDIGTHIENLVHYLTGLRIARLCARLDVFGAGRALDDNASILLEYQGGAKGLYSVEPDRGGLRQRPQGPGLRDQRVRRVEPGEPQLPLGGAPRPAGPGDLARPGLALPARAELFPAPGGTSRGILRGLREPLPELHPGGGHPEGGRGTQKGGPRFPGSGRGYLRGALHRAVRGELEEGRHLGGLLGRERTHVSRRHALHRPVGRPALCHPLPEAAVVGV